ncbi:TNF receptor-associated factor 2-like [Oculina patagonica]
MPGYTLSLNSTVDERYLCSLCSNLLKDPVQTGCGHVYCNSCITDLKRDDGSFICLVDKTPFAAEQVFLDNFMKREVLSLVVACPNTSDGCVWKGEVRYIEKHLLSCPAERESCPNYSCGQRVKRSDLQRHVEQECLYRPQPCPFCGDTITAIVLKNHQAQDCKMYPVQCRGCGKEGIPRGEMANHLSPINGDCEAVERNCAFQQIGCSESKKMKQSEAKKHNELSSIFHLNLLLTFVLRLEEQVKSSLAAGGAFGGGISDHWMRGSERSISSAISSIDTVVRETTDMRQKLQDNSERLVRLERTVASHGERQPVAPTFSSLQSGNMTEEISRRLTNAENGSNNIEFLLSETGREINDVKQEVSSLKRQLDNAVDSIRRLERRMESTEHNMALRNVVLSDIEEYVRRQQVSTYDGTLLWKITDYARRRNDAITGRQTSIYSPCFYTSRHGYKMCARLYLKGDGMGKGTHLSLFFVVMRGEFDALLRWPFRQKVTMMLLDQDNVEHVIDAFRPDPSSSSFQRPRRESNIASGCPLFCPLSELNNHAYVRDDAMFLKIIVDTVDL